MIDWTDRHCRFFHRLLAPRARLYTEMITTGALAYSDRERHLDFDASEHPVALQLGGSELDALATSAKMGERWGYDEINLNCGCPSERVLKGSFGACLMADPMLVADCYKAMRDAVDIPVTLKHRIGLDKNESYEFVRDFVGASYDAGCRVFYRACAQRDPEGAVAEGKSRNPAAALRRGAALEAGLSGCGVRAERRLAHGGSDRGRTGAARWGGRWMA